MPRSYSYIRDPRFETSSDGTTIDLWAKDKKFSDLKAHLQGKLKVSAPGPVDLSSFCVAMNQYDLDSCVGNGACESLEILENIANQATSGYQPTLLSRMFLWAMCRTQDGTLAQNTGTHVRTAFNVLATLGVCTETTWPYDDSLTAVSPSIVAQQQALGHTLSAAYRIDSLMQDRINDIITALQAKLPVVFGTDVTTAFDGVSSNTPVDVPTATDTIAGGHCMVIVGWDGTNFLVKNSWGTAWGANGFCVLTPAYMTWDNTTDLWVPTLAPMF